MKESKAKKTYNIFQTPIKKGTTKLQVTVLPKGLQALQEGTIQFYNLSEGGLAVFLRY